MKIRKLLIGAYCCALFLGGCSGDGEDDCEEGLLELPNSIDIIDGAAYRQSLIDCRVPRIQNFRASNLEGGQITAAQGTTIFVNPQTFEQNGIFIDGDVDIALIEMYEPGEIIACQLSTNGINLSGNTEPLFSESIFYLDITYLGDPVTFLQPIRVFIPSQNLGEQQYLFASPSCPELECKVLWEEEVTTVPVFEKPIVDPDGNPIFGYQSNLMSVGWKNIGRYNEDTRDRSTIFNKPPAGYDKTNSNVFIVYNSPSNAIGLFDTFDTNLEVFTERFAQIPVGQAGSVIFVTFQNSQYVYGIKNGVVQEDWVTATLETQEINETGFINTLNGL